MSPVVCNHCGERAYWVQPESFAKSCTVIFKDNSSSGASLTPYSGVIFWRVLLTPKRSLKNSFSGVKVTPDIEELK